MREIDKNHISYMLNAIKRYHVKAANATKALKTVMDGHGIVSIGNDLEDDIVSFLDSTISQKNNWFAYFIYECDFGENPLTVTIYGNDFILDGYEPFFDILRVSEDITII